MNKKEIQKIFSDMVANPSCLVLVGGYYLIGLVAMLQLEESEIDTYFDAYNPPGYNDFHKCQRISKKDLDGFLNWLIR